ncbi:hypothetical protein [Nocardia stercoris]|uniref:Uncharacterized protein n=1 Tax=Nocardia stercoris TaxID=2483361 RepID=A0A3M2L2H3_9NOCA|nr:hypothetical protein [Nocardia stercoris]RMI31919.1 hypothetical protein EBN03_17285 [Nocardia stercoris]
MTKLQNTGRLSVALAVVGFGLLAGTATAVAAPADIATSPAYIPAGSSALSVQPACPPLPTPISGAVATPLIVCPLATPAAAPAGGVNTMMITQSGAAALQVVQLLESFGIPPLSAELPFGSVLPCPSASAAPGTVCPM